ncbi:MAG: DUF1838 family protein [Rhodospirillaceae bacterium]|nr:DUF1838 family protein [Rhodospirillaceae bacterium]
MTDPAGLSRRDLGEAVMGAALGIGGMLAPHAARASTEPDRVAGMSLADRVRAFMKAQASLNEEKVIWRTRGVIMAYVPGRTPEPMLRFKGCEQQWVKPISDTKFVRYNSLINFMCDYETDEIISEFKNPFTGKTNKVSHYVSRVPEGMEISEEGVFINIVRQAYPEFYQDSTFDMDIAVIEDEMSFRGEVKWPAELRQPPSGSMQSFFSRYSEVMDPKTSWAHCHFAGHVLMNWYPWMEMPDQPGHMLWHATGYKVRSWDSLPKDYLAKATKDYAEIFDKSPEFDPGPSAMAKRLKASGRLP